MTDAPKFIWAVPERNCTVYMSGNSPITAQDGPFTHHRHGEAVRYIRADAPEVQALVDALRELRGGDMWTQNAEDAITSWEAANDPR